MLGCHNVCLTALGVESVRKSGYAPTIEQVSEIHGGCFNRMFYVKASYTNSQSLQDSLAQKQNKSVSAYFHQSNSLGQP